MANQETPEAADDLRHALNATDDDLLARARAEVEERRALTAELAASPEGEVG